MQGGGDYQAEIFNERDENLCQLTFNPGLLLIGF